MATDSEKDALKAELAALRAEAKQLTAQGPATSVEQATARENRANQIADRAEAIAARLKEIDAKLAQTEIEQLKKEADAKMLAFNIAQSKLDQVPRSSPISQAEKDALTTAESAYAEYAVARRKLREATGGNATTGPTHTTPNATNEFSGSLPEPAKVNAEQASNTQSYNTPAIADPTTVESVNNIQQATENPTMKTIGNSFDSAMSAIGGLTGDLLKSATSAIGSLSVFSSAPKLADDMEKQIKLTASNQTLIYNAASQQLDPTNQNNPNKCASMSDYIGAMQGKYNSALSSITSGLGSILGVIGNITSSILGGLTSAISALTNAIATGINAVIQLAIGGLKLATGLITTALGPVANLLGGISSAISSVASGIAGEASNIISAVGKQFAGPFTTAISNCNTCMKAAQTTETATKPLLVDDSGKVIGAV